VPGASIRIFSQLSRELTVASSFYLVSVINGMGTMRRITIVSKAIDSYLSLTSLAQSPNRPLKNSLTVPESL